MQNKAFARFTLAGEEGCSAILAVAKKIKHIRATQSRSKMLTDYQYQLAQCDVNDKKSLQSFRAKRRLWLLWIDGDEHHAIWQALHSMIWADVSFRVLTGFAGNDSESALHNHLLGEALINGHVATQVLAIRRLFDDSSKDIISLRKLIKDIKNNARLFTRENYICFDGLPYDYEAVQQAEMIGHLGKGAHWAATTGPSAWGMSQMMHEQFDRLAGIDPANRRRDDKLPKSLFETLERTLLASGANDLAKWSHVYLAHAGNPEQRKRIAALHVTSDKITAATKALCRVTEAISAWIIGEGSRRSSVMPAAQFDQFDKLCRPVMPKAGREAAVRVWHQLSDERDAYLDDIDPEILRHQNTI